MFILNASSVFLWRPNALFLREILPKWRNTTNENSVEQGAPRDHRNWDAHLDVLHHNHRHEA